MKAIVGYPIRLLKLELAKSKKVQSRCGRIISRPMGKEKVLQRNTTASLSSIFLIYWWVHCMVILVGLLDQSVEAKPVLVIGCTGPSAAGKTELVKFIQRVLNTSDVGVMHQDDYFIDLDKLPTDHYVNGHPNGDHPSAIHFDLMIQQIEAIKQGQSIQMPRYDFIIEKSLPDGEVLGPVKVLIVEGIQLLWNPRLRQLIDYAIYVDTSGDIRLGRRILRDSQERGKTIESSLKYYLDVVRLMQVRYTESTRRYADRFVDGMAPSPDALEIGAAILRYLQGDHPIFLDREVYPYSPKDPLIRGQSIAQQIWEQGSVDGQKVILFEGGSFRAPTQDHLGMMIQVMQRFGFTNGRFVPANGYKPGAISNAAALLLLRVAVEYFHEALEATGVSYSNFRHTHQMGALWTGSDGRDYRVQVDETEINIRNPIVGGEDIRTLLAFRAFKKRVGGDARSVFWLAGGDSFASLPEWNKRWEEHLDLANWIIVARPEFEGQDRNVDFYSTDPIYGIVPESVRSRYLYYFDHTTQTHIYENIDPLKPNIYVIRLPKNGVISSTSVRQSISGQPPDSSDLVARAGTTPAVFNAIQRHRLFETQTRGGGADGASCAEAIKAGIGGGAE